MHLYVYSVTANAQPRVSHIRRFLTPFVFVCFFLLLLNNCHHYILLVEKGNMTAPANGVAVLYYIHTLQVGPGNFFFLDS